MFAWILKLLGLRKKETVLETPTTAVKKEEPLRTVQYAPKDAVSMHDIVHKEYPVRQPIMSQGIKPTEREYQRCERVRHTEPTTRRDIVQNITHVHEDRGFGLLDTMVAVHVLSDLTSGKTVHHEHLEHNSHDSFGGGQSGGGGASREYEDTKIIPVSSILESSYSSIESSASLGESSDSFGSLSDSFGGSDDD
jgi:hypothetical protein